MSIPNQKKRAASLRRVGENQKQLKKWAEHAPKNYRYHWLLIEAELQRVGSQPENALQYYDQAIDMAKGSGVLHEEALGHELCARCHFQLRHERLAIYNLSQAHQLYERWGAASKLVQLRGEFPQLALMVGPTVDMSHASLDRTTYRRTGSTSVQPQSFDIMAITEASQAISSEIHIDKLTTTLLKIVIEHSGAQRASLILKSKDGLFIQAQGVAGLATEVSVEKIALDEMNDPPLPRSIIQYVRRTGESLRLHDVSSDSNFSRDTYVLREKPLSVLCEPIMQQGKLMGILYLENNLTTGAFTEDRLQLLRLLSAQAAISIENATLYFQLEQKVVERTEKLQAALLEQEHLNAELRVSSQQLEVAHGKLHEANQLLQVRADTDGLTGLANRRYFNERLSYELDRCTREKQPLALIMCDLDNFKNYNDTYGHVAGDDCLRSAVGIFKTVFNRGTDLVARYGGEEFVVLLPAINCTQAALLGEELRLALVGLNLVHSGNPPHGIVTISVGCHSLIPDTNTTHEMLIRMADKALYQAKDNGRNCLVQVCD